MAVPDFQSLMLPLLKVAADGKKHSLAEAREALAAHSASPGVRGRTCLAVANDPWRPRGRGAVRAPFELRHVCPLRLRRWPWPRASCPRLPTDALRLSLRAYTNPPSNDYGRQHRLPIWY